MKESCLPVETLLEEVDGMVHVAACDIANMAGEPLSDGGRVPTGRRLDTLLAGLRVALDDLVAAYGGQHPLLDNKGKEM